MICVSSKNTLSIGAALAALWLFLPRIAAADVGPLQVHGAVSVTAGYSDKYNYLGETADHLDVFDDELTLNATHRFNNGVRFGVQTYAYKLNGYSDLTLDFASLDYAFNEQLGVRVGRSKQALGFFGDTQDIDMVRPFALLPLNVYPKSMRSYAAAYDGAAVYGNLPVGQAGSIDYQVYGGRPARFKPTDPWIRITNESTPFNITEIKDVGRLLGGSLYWNTPLEGLKVGASILRNTDADFRGYVRTAAEMMTSASDIRLLPTFFPPGFWDSVVAGKYGSTLGNAVTQGFFSADYTRGAWEFTAEYKFTQLDLTTVAPVLGSTPVKNRQDDVYGMVTWQAATKLQLGAYYAVSAANTKDRRGHTNVSVAANRAWQRDAAVAASYSLRPWWLLKAEVHALNGTQILGSGTNGDAATWQPNWTLLVLKSTISF
jgi:hypothetical protein